MLLLQRKAFFHGPLCWCAGTWTGVTDRSISLPTQDFIQHKGKLVIYVQLVAANH